MTFLSSLRGLFPKPKLVLEPIEVQTSENTLHLIQDTPEQRHLVVYGRLPDALRFLKQCEAVNLKAKIYSRKELDEARHQLAEGDTIPIMNVGLASVGWRVTCKDTFNVHCLSKQDEPHVMQLLHRAKCNRSVVWNVNELTVLDRLWESPGVWFYDEPETISFNPRDFDFQRSFLLRHLENKNSGMP